MNEADRDDYEPENHIVLPIDEGEPVQPRPMRQQILALSGGGYRGLYTAIFLAHVEGHFGVQCGRRFELLSGTSIGGLIAAALAVGIPAQEIADKFRKHGPIIFKRSLVTPLQQLLLFAPYSAEKLKAAVLDTLGDQANLSMQALQKPLLLCAMNYTYGRPEIYCSGGLAGLKASNATVVEAVLASAAAPTYFPPQKRGNDEVIDGGIIANAPEVVALAETRQRWGWSHQETYILAVGTASPRQVAALRPLGRPSTLEWMVRRQLFQSTMAAQESLAASQCRSILGSRYLRIDNVPQGKQAEAVALDKADVEATTTLQSLAEASWQRHQHDSLLSDFFQ